MKELFKFIGQYLPSKSACSAQVYVLADSQLNQIKQFLVRTPTICFVDESEISGKKYLNILVKRFD